MTAAPHVRDVQPALSKRLREARSSRAFSSTVRGAPLAQAHDATLTSPSNGETKMNRAFSCAAAVTLVLSLPISAFAEGPDFDGDGSEDLVIPVPGATVFGHYGAGRVLVRMGDGAEVILTDASVAAGENFGHSIAWGDFDDNQFTDLAVGIPGDGAGDQGGVRIFPGNPAGLSASSSYYFGVGTTGGPGTDAAFGWSLAAGDFDGDNCDDLAIGAAFENVAVPNYGTVAELGSVRVYYGIEYIGLAIYDDHFISVSSTGSLGLVGFAESNLHVGYAIAAGDFDNNGCDDLAIGARGDYVYPHENAGSVYVLYGTTGRALGNDEHFYQGSTGLLEGATAEDEWVGGALAAGDLDGNGYDDLAIGAPGETVNGQTRAGRVYVIRGTTGGLGNGVLSVLDQIGLPGSPTANDGFGGTLAFGHFNASTDAYADLAIGAAGDLVGGVDGAGSVTVIYGIVGAGLNLDTVQVWDRGPISGSVTANDRFGLAIYTGDFDDANGDDILIGAPYDDISSGGSSYTDAGSASVVYSSGSSGLAATNNELLTVSDFGLSPSLSARFGGWGSLY
jgi:hypothetical protein